MKPIGDLYRDPLEERRPRRWLPPRRHSHPRPPFLFLPAALLFVLVVGSGLTRPATPLRAAVSPAQVEAIRAFEATHGYFPACVESDCRPGGCDGDHARHTATLRAGVDTVTLHASRK